MIASAMTTAGRKPAAKRAATETLATEAMTIIRMQGGTRMPMAEAAADPAHEHLGEPDEADGDAARLHQRARQDEERDGEQHEGVHALEGLLHDHGQRVLPGPQEPEEAGDADDEGHRHAEQEEREEGDGDEGDHEARASLAGRPPARARQRCGRAYRIISAPPAGM